MNRNCSSILFCVASSIFVLLCAITFSTPAQADTAVKNQIAVNKAKNHSKWCSPYQHITINDENVDDISALVGEKLIYEYYSEETGMSYYYKYDMKKNITYLIGEMRKATTYIGDLAQIGNKIYQYMSYTGAMESELYHPENTGACVLYEIDVEKNSIQAIYTEEMYNSLIYIDVLNGSVLGAKGKMVNGTAMTYIDKVDVNQKKGQLKADVLASTTFQEHEKVKKSVHLVSQYDGFIYNLVKEESEDSSQYKIAKYAADGKLVKEIPCDKTLTKLITDNGFWKLEIMGNYAYIGSGNMSTLCDISGDIATAKVMTMDGLRMKPTDGSDTGENSRYVLFYSGTPCKVWLLDLQENTFSQLDVGYKSIRYILKDENTNVLFVARDDEEKEHSIYVDYLDLPVLNTQSLDGAIPILLKK